MQLEDMEVTTQTLNLQPFSVVSEGIFTSEVGLEAPFLTIPSPTNLNKWSQLLPVETNS